MRHTIIAHSLLKMRELRLEAARARLEHAAALFGHIEIVDITELSPVWRSLLHALAGHVPQVRWIAGPRPGTRLARRRGDRDRGGADAQAPAISAVSAATTYHKAVEAMRWGAHAWRPAGRSPPTSPSRLPRPPDYDDHLLALRADANLDLHFVHGVKVTASREGAGGGGGARSQRRALEAGQRFRHLQRAGMTTAAMGDIQRQRTPEASGWWCRRFWRAIPARRWSCCLGQQRARGGARRSSARWRLGLGWRSTSPPRDNTLLIAPDPCVEGEDQPDRPGGAGG